MYDDDDDDDDDDSSCRALVRCDKRYCDMISQAI